LGSGASCLAGLLLGTAVGDALGLPAEGLSRARLQRLWHGEWRHRFVCGHGMLSDDTEHTLFVAQALLATPRDAAAFQRALAWKLRGWLLGLPAGVGFATLRAILKLWLGCSPEHSGVFSAGNGPAMRSAILGVYFADDEARLIAFTTASTRLTHTDPRALTGALAVALAAAHATREPPLGVADLLARLATLAAAGDLEWPRLLAAIQQQLAAGTSVAGFAEQLGLGRGISGYVYHTVPIALYAWLRHPGDFRAALTAALDCGGDTDTVGAIVGAISGAGVGAVGVPSEWLAGICDWPRSPALLLRVAGRLAAQRERGGDPESGGGGLGAVAYAWPLLPVRNLGFLVIVLLHGLRRLLPPHR